MGSNIKETNNAFTGNGDKRTNGACLNIMSSSESREQRALNLIFDAGTEGLLQSYLWKELDISSREASRIAKRFVDQGKVKRERVLSNGRWTYRLHFIVQPVTLNSIEGCPCLVCVDIEKCFIGGNRDPTICIDITAWIDPRID